MIGKQRTPRIQHLPNSTRNTRRGAGHDELEIVAGDERYEGGCLGVCWGGSHFGLE